MSENDGAPDPEPIEPEWDESMVTRSLFHTLLEEHPGWRLVDHHTPAGRRVIMIEFDDGHGGFTPGLPREFVALVSNASTDTEKDQDQNQGDDHE